MHIILLASVPVVSRARAIVSIPPSRKVPMPRAPSTAAIKKRKKKQAETEPSKDTRKQLRSKFIQPTSSLLALLSDRIPQPKKKKRNNLKEKKPKTQENNSEVSSSSQQSLSAAERQNPPSDICILQRERRARPLRAEQRVQGRSRDLLRERCLSARDLRRDADEDEVCLPSTAATQRTWDRKPPKKKKRNNKVAS